MFMAGLMTACWLLFICGYRDPPKNSNYLRQQWNFA
jgi:hypothetical protein